MTNDPSAGDSSFMNTGNSPPNYGVSIIDSMAIEQDEWHRYYAEILYRLGTIPTKITYSDLVIKNRKEINNMDLVVEV